MRKILSFSSLALATLVSLPVMADQTLPGVNCRPANNVNMGMGADGAMQNPNGNAVDVYCPVVNISSITTSVTPSVIVNDGTNTGIVSCNATTYSGDTGGTAVTGATVSTTAADLGKKSITLDAMSLTAPGGSLYIKCTLPAAGMMGGGTASSVITYSIN